MTRSVANGMARGSFNVVEFYAGRARRLAPALFFMLAIVGLVCFLLPVYSGFLQFRLFRRSLASSVLFVSNIYAYGRAGGYFDVPAGDWALLHTWFLGVEAQFCLVFPLFAILVSKINPRSLGRALFLAMLASFVLAVVAAAKVPDAAYYFLPTRAWELLLGGCFAILRPSPGGPGQKRAVAAIGLSMVLLPALLFNRVVHPAIPGGWMLVPCLGTGLFLTGSDGYRDTGSFKPLMRIGVLVAVGRLSYSLYLWHWPAFVIFRRLTLEQYATPAAFIGLGAAIVGLAWFSRKFIEMPAQAALAKLGPSRQLAVCAAVGLALIVADLTPGTPSLLSTGYASEEDGGVTNTPGDFPYIGDIGKGGAVDFVLWGDSHARVLSKLLDALGKDTGKKGRLLYCYGLLNGHKREESEWVKTQKEIEGLIERERYGVAFIALRWTVYINGYLPSEKTSSSWAGIEYVYEFGTRKLAGGPALEAGLRDAIAYLKAHGAQMVYLVLPVPENAYEIPRAATVLGTLLHKDENAINDLLSRDMSWYRERNGEALEILRRVAGDFSFVETIDPVPVFCSTGEHCRVVQDGHSLYIDDDHLSKAGAWELAPLFKSCLGSSMEHPWPK